MQKWLEIDMRARLVPVDYAIIAIMLKATLATLVGSRLDRTIRRYARIAQQLGSATFESTLSSSIFTVHEINKVLRVLPQEFDPPSEELTEEDIAKLDAANRAAQGQSELMPQKRLEPMPDLKPVEQKGLGLESLKRSLGSLDPEYLDETKHPQDEQSRTERQIRLERDVADAALDRWRAEYESFEQNRNQGKLQQAPLGSQIYQWIENMASKLAAELENAEDPSTQPTTKEEHDLVTVAPFLRVMAPDRVSSVAVLQFFATIMDPALSRKGLNAKPAVVRACEKIGMAFFTEAQIDKIQTHYYQTLSSLPSAERQKRLSRLMKGKKWSQKDVEAEYAKIASRSPAPDVEPWVQNHTLAIRIGAVLLGILLKVAKITTYLPDPTTGKRTVKTQPAATYFGEWRQGKKIGSLRVPEELYQMVKKEPVASLIAKHLPMIVRPKPWTNLKEGGYLTTSVPVIRFSDFQTSQKAYVQLAHQRGDMDRVYAGLDVISKTGWRVNNELLRVMIDVWNSGERVGKLVAEVPTVDMPPRPDSDDPKTIARWRLIVKTIQNAISSNHSQRCYQNFQLEVARAFSNTVFYCPQNVDYRGRAYPIAPYFNHTGADHVRALFNFAEGKELGPEGLFWLKVQLANVYGYDKASLSDRAAFVDANVDNIQDSAINPLRGRRWWLEAGDPWQTLAACMDLTRALELPDPAKHVSHLPIQQDGSCNGLQHYAALGGDEVGARQVNLSPGDKPADVYTGVAELVKDIVHRDAEAGDPRAQALDGHVTRKMVKQPVMTNVYGVTYHGATHQVAKQLREILPASERSMNPDTTTYRLSAYITTCIFKALNEMFTGAQAIQTWLGECGARISSAVTPEQITRIKARREDSPSDLRAEVHKIYRKSQLRGPRVVHPPDDSSFMSTIVWTTPLGLPVVQPYRDYRKKQVKTHLQDIFILTPSGTDPVNKRRQLQGFAPNFIHSLDATHMMLSALKCDEIGLTFGSVHDSFWTHAADVPTLNRVLRDAFVSMHKDNIVRRLKEEFEARYKGCYVRTSARIDTPLGQRLLQHYKDVKGRRRTAVTRRTVSGGVEIDDLLEEVERAELLRSEDPAKREQGAQMVTPSSIAEEADAGDDEVYCNDEWGDWINKTSKPVMPESVTSEAENEQALEEALSEDSEDAEEAAFAPEEAVEYEDAEAEPEAKSEAEAVESEADHESEAVESEAAENFQNATDDVEGQLPPRRKRGRKPKVKSEADLENARMREHRAKARANATPRRPARVFFWKVISFPEPPPKGGFDVTRLRESQYFFS